MVLGFSIHLTRKEGFPGGSGERTHLPMQDPLEKGMVTHSSILARRIPWTEEPGGLQSIDHKESDMTEATQHARTLIQEMKETWVRSLGWEDRLKKEMATCSSILAWRIPWTKKPGELLSRGSQRVGQLLPTEHTQLQRTGCRLTSGPLLCPNDTT